MDIDNKDCQAEARSYTFFDVLFIPSYNLKLMSVCSAVARWSIFNFAAPYSHIVVVDGEQISDIIFLSYNLRRIILVTKKKESFADAPTIGAPQQPGYFSLITVDELEYSLLDESISSAK